MRLPWPEYQEYHCSKQSVPPTKAYRVTLRTTYKIEVDVEAENESQARGKAYECSLLGVTGDSLIGSYFAFDDAGNSHFIVDDGELTWEVVDIVGDSEVIEVEELEDGEFEFDIDEDYVN
jgi:hypothetical protein